MAFMQSELPPSTAPVTASRVPVAASRARRDHSWILTRAPVWLFGAALLIVPGYLAAEATESIAVGILAGDLAFLIAVACWSSVSGGTRR